MRKITVDNKKVTAKNASLLGFSTRTVKAGSFFSYRNGDRILMARSLGRIASCDNDGDNCVGYVCAMVLSEYGRSCYERWINPDDILESYQDAPSKLAAFFFAPTLPYDTHTMRRLIDHGTTQEQFIESHKERVSMFQEREHN